MQLPDIVLRPSSEIKKLIRDGAQASKGKVIFVQGRAQNSLEILHFKCFILTIFSFSLPFCCFIFMTWSRPWWPILTFGLYSFCRLFKGCLFQQVNNWEVVWASKCVLFFYNCLTSFVCAAVISVLFGHVYIF